MQHHNIYLVVGVLTPESIACLEDIFMLQDPTIQKAGG